MDIHIEIGNNPQVGIATISVGVKCSACGHRWGVYLTPVSNQLPSGWDVCTHCHPAHGTQNISKEYYERSKSVKQSQ